MGQETPSNNAQTNEHEQTRVGMASEKASGMVGTKHQQRKGHNSKHTCDKTSPSAFILAFRTRRHDSPLIKLTNVLIPNFFNHI